MVPVSLVARRNEYMELKPDLRCSWRCRFKSWASRFWHHVEL